MPEVSIVIVCMNRTDNLYPCLHSILAHTELSCETFVVAYLFSKDKLDKARIDFPWVKFIVSDEPRGFAENNNLALRQATGKYCFVLNDDTQMCEGVIDRLVEDFRRLPEQTAIVCPKLLNSDLSLQLCGRPPYPAYKYVLQQFHLYREPIDNVSGKESVFEQVYRTYNISGAAFLINTSVFRELGLFDEKYFFTPEDIALSTLANQKGYGVYVDAGVSIIHKWKATSSRMLPATRPAAVRGSLLFWGGRSRLHYAMIAVPVWCAESLKLVKALIRMSFRPSEENRIKLKTFHNITRNIFTCRSPKEVFVRHYNELNNE